jgi:hypothetical protein
MNLSGVTFRGPELVESLLLSELPTGYANLLRQINGFIAFDGGFHLRGVCDTPTWHSLSEAWRGASALHRLFPAVHDSDLPFGQDCMGDQFLLRDSVVHKLSAEAGELSSMSLSFREFFNGLTADPFEFLQLHPLAQFQRDGGHLEPGQLLAAYPPFITKEAANGVTLRAISAGERVAFLADMARQLAGIPDGGQFRVVFTE